jgi:hypothetical protein
MALLSVRNGFPIPNDPSRAYFGTDTHASGVALGAALAAAFSITSTAAVTPAGLPSVAVRRSLDAIGVAALLAVVWFYLDLDEYSMFLYRGGFVVVDAVVLVLVVALANPAGKLGGLLGVQPLRWLGLRSYGVYLWHWPVFMFTRPQADVPVGGAANLALRLALTLGAAELSYRFVEVPIRTRGFRSFAAGLARRWSPRPLRPSLRPLLPAAALALPVTLALTGLYVVRPPAAPVLVDLSGGQVQEDEPPAPPAPEAPASPSPASPSPAPAATRPPVDPSWPKSMTVITDSVMLGTKHVLPAALPGWRVDYRGRVSLRLPTATGELRSGHKPVGSVVVVGLGYNSSWQKNRQNYDLWAAQLDKQADDMLAALAALGAKKIVWVTLREVSVDNVPASARWQQRERTWYFPYVNERLHAFVQRHPEVTLADWAAVSNRPGLTFDAIHLRPEGAALMAETVKAAIGLS